MSNNNNPNPNNDNNNRKCSPPGSASLDETVDEMARNPELLSFIERNVQTLVLQDPSITVESVTQRLVEQVLSQNPHFMNPQVQPPARDTVVTAPRRISNEVSAASKSVSFSQTTDSVATRIVDNSHIILPPTGDGNVTTVDALLANVVTGATDGATTTSDMATAGETTVSTVASDSSVASLQRSQPNPNTVVRFSALNPNPHLMLRSTEGAGTTINDGSDNAVPGAETLQRAVSFEDDTGRASRGSSRASRSGYSSPSIEPPASPPRSRENSHITFNDSAIEIITEAAARLRNEEREGVENADESLSSSNHGRSPRVRFSAMRSDAIVDGLPRNTNPPNISLPPTEHVDASENEIEIQRVSINDQNTSNGHVHFVGVSDDERGFNSIDTDVDDEVRAVADRLRRVIRRAEALGNVTLEAAFEQFDSDHSGIITPQNLQASLRRLGETFDFSVEECTELLDHLSGGEHRNGINLLGFYRAMGRRSPPLHPEQSPEMDLAESPAVHADNAAQKLRFMMRDSEAEGGIESTFRLFDRSASGSITSVDFHSGLRQLREDLNFEDLNDADCEELVALFDTNRDGRVSLLDFYRFMGRRSPPLGDDAFNDEKMIPHNDRGNDDGDTEEENINGEGCKTVTIQRRHSDNDDDQIGGGSGGSNNSGSLFIPIGTSRVASNDAGTSSTNGNSSTGNERSASDTSYICSFKSIQEECERERSGVVEVILQQPTPLSVVVPSNDVYYGSPPSVIFNRSHLFTRSETDSESIGSSTNWSKRDDDTDDVRIASPASNNTRNQPIRESQNRFTNLTRVDELENLLIAIDNNPLSLIPTRQVGFEILRSHSGASPIFVQDDS